MRIDRIDTRYIDFGIGVLRGVLSQPEKLPLSAPHEVEAAMEHMRGAARLVERLQRKIAKARRPPRRRRRT